MTESEPRNLRGIEDFSAAGVQYCSPEAFVDALKQADGVPLNVAEQTADRMRYFGPKFFPVAHPGYDQLRAIWEEYRSVAEARGIDTSHPQLGMDPHLLKNFAVIMGFTLQCAQKIQRRLTEDRDGMEREFQIRHSIRNELRRVLELHQKMSNLSGIDTLWKLARCVNKRDDRGIEAILTPIEQLSGEAGKSITALPVDAHLRMLYSAEDPLVEMRRRIKTRFSYGAEFKKVSSILNPHTGTLVDQLADSRHEGDAGAARAGRAEIWSDLPQE